MFVNFAHKGNEGGQLHFKQVVNALTLGQLKRLQTGLGRAMPL